VLVPRPLVVQARDLDTDERVVASFEVEMPPDEAGQRAQLAEVVARLHPGARMRSFGDGAASFLDSQRLVVAHYGGVPEQVVRESPGTGGGPMEQQRLFAG
jgi:hypothetical protein